MQSGREEIDREWSECNEGETDGDEVGGERLESSAS
jgi:hypothetical protein